MNELLSKVRPQVFLSIMCGTLISITISLIAWRLGSIEIITGVTGAVFGFLAGISSKLLEAE
jgi:hypothetical protein|tara:strand:- start:1178 stop:1363 length:186 start_codon:yes stop_codon:yes gene_type:complete